MKYAIGAATLGAALAFSASALAQPYYVEAAPAYAYAEPSYVVPYTERVESIYERPSDRANSSIWAEGDNQIHSTPAIREANGLRNNFSQDGTSMVGGGAMTGPSTREAQAFGAAAGGSTGGTKSGGD